MSVRSSFKLDRSHRLIKNLNRRNIETTLDNALSHGADLMVAKVHVVTGELESSLDYESSGLKGKLIAGAEHARFEIEKGGEHDFMTNAVEATRELLISDLEELVSG